MCPKGSMTPTTFGAARVAFSGDSYAVANFPAARAALAERSAVAAARELLGSAGHAAFERRHPSPDAALAFVRAAFVSVGFDVGAHTPTLSRRDRRSLVRSLRG